MGTTGLIFTAIAVAWLAYLVPHFARRREDQVVEEVDPAHRFSDSVRMLRRGTAPLLDQNLAVLESFEVSTPMTRRAAIEDLRRLDRLAARRRRRVLLALLVALSGAVASAAAELTPWWSTAVPGALLGAFLVVARFSVRVMRRSLDARYADICRGSEEFTVLLSRTDVAQLEDVHHPLKFDTPARPGTLWDPVPITVPTYVSKPLAPRTVRTIDLSGPELTSVSRPALPVTADPYPAVAVDRGSRHGDERGDDRGEEMPSAASA